MTEGWHEASRLRTVEGERIHYVDMGSGGTPVLLIHGFLMSSYMWRENLEFLSRDRRAIALCLPGCGWSDVGAGPYDIDEQGRRVVGLMDALGIERAHLVGHSMGGAIALWIARHHPERVARMGLICALAVQKPMPAPWVFANRRLAILYRVFFRPAMARKAVEGLAYNGMKLDAEYMRHFIGPLRRSGGVEAALLIAQVCRSVSNGSPGELAEIHPESLVLWGEKDRLLPERVGVRLAERLPNARFLSFRGCGHSPHEEQPERFNREIHAFLDAS